MSKFLLDTTVLIDFSKGHEPTRSHILKLLESDNEIGICSITVAEFCAGLSNEKRKTWEEFFTSFPYWDITQKTAQQAGYFRYDYKKKGKQLTTADTLLAALALQEKATIVTDNVKDYPMNKLTTTPP